MGLFSIQILLTQVNNRGPKKFLDRILTKAQNGPKLAN
jgi:hypothetical protein